ncbi:hypothetical protein MUA04_02115 [Enterobacteriaceae bacterium H11S18]|uniref:hypothetical protein n=1 Tax=Dryocola clanedunensis TaxID=2925396 RepID=UPI0022F09BB8|nr:hypothetical protein [Dryocola clanedunensis]MCT4709011.1 hypothetical protein [Dryocola clanedunensis]
MNDQPGNVVTQAFAWLAALAAGLGITTQDVVYMIFGLTGVAISFASYISGRLDAHRRQKEDEKRTQLLEDYLAALPDKNTAKSPAIVNTVSEVVKRAGGL